VVTFSRLLKIIGLFCKRALKKRQYSAKETYNFKEPTKRSHPICVNEDAVYNTRVDVSLFCSVLQRVQQLLLSIPLITPAIKGLN